MVCFVLGWVLATILGTWALPETPWLLGAAGLLLGGLLVLRKILCRKWNTRWNKRVHCLLLGAALGFCWFFVWNTVWYTAAKQAVGEEPQAVTLRVIDTPWETDYGGAVYARLTGARPVKTLVYLREYDAALSPGDRITGLFALSKSSEFSEYYDATGTLLIAKQRGTYAVVSSGTGLLYAPKRAAARLRQVIDQCFDAESCGLVKALLTGDRSGLTDSFSADLKNTGIYHAVAISGLHVSLLAQLLYRLFGKRRRLAALVTLPTLILYAAMTGGAPSVCRAVVMESVLLLAPVAGRDYDPPTGLCAAIFLLLLPNPLAIRHIGFQLSVASVAGLLLFSDKLERYLAARRPFRALTEKGGLWKLATEGIAASVGTSMSALIFSMPLLAGYFGTVSLAAPLTNLLGLWAVVWTFVLGGVTTLLGLIWLPLGQSLAWLPALGVSWLRGLTGMLSKLPLTCLSTQNGLTWAFLALVYLLLGYFLVAGPPKRLSRPICCCTLALCLTVAIPVLASRRATYDFRLLDVGQGQCVLLTSRSASAIIDCGGSDGAGAGDLAAALCRTKGETTVDLLILTHYDWDHISGVEELLHQISVKTVCLPETGADGEQRQALEELVTQAGSELLELSQDCNIVFGVGRLRLFAPSDSGDSNDCLAVLASFGDMDFLVTGDLDQVAEAELAERANLSEIEVLVAGHHGSATSTGQALLDAARPETVLISVGRNSYGHPAEETLDRIQKSGAIVRRTDQEGTIQIRR